jgi:organic radical activating enzyme
MDKPASCIIENGLKLPVIEEFYSVQGEGFHTGKPAYFIRLGGCDIGCHWCDTKYAWNYETHRLTDVKTIVNNAVQYPASAVVVTGGEPTQYNLQSLTLALKTNGLKTYLETSGIFLLSGEWDWICLSPKQQSPPLIGYFNIAGELKVIIQDEEDFRWAEENARKVNPSCRLYLQPEWSKYKTIIPLIVEYVKNDPKWNISLQIHKFMKIP